MTPIKVKMLHYKEDDNNEFKWKTQFINGDAITSMYIGDAEEVEGEEVKCYEVVCGVEFLSLKPEQHLYQFLFDKFFKNALKAK